MTTENILMSAVQKGGDRQELHEKIRQLSIQAANRVKAEGKDNNLLELINNDPVFSLTQEDLNDILKPENISEEQLNLQTNISKITCDRSWKKINIF